MAFRGAMVTVMDAALAGRSRPRMPSRFLTCSPRHKRLSIIYFKRLG